MGVNYHNSPVTTVKVGCYSIHSMHMHMQEM